MHLNLKKTQIFLQFYQLRSTLSRYIAFFNKPLFLFSEKLVLYQNDVILKPQRQSCSFMNWYSLNEKLYMNFFFNHYKNAQNIYQLRVIHLMSFSGTLVFGQKSHIC